MRARLGAVGGLLAGLVVGAVLTLAIQGSGRSPITVHAGAPRGRAGAEVPPVAQEPTTTFLAWSPAGVPAGFGRRAATVTGFEHVTVVAEDNAWLTSSWSADGHLIDRPRAPYMIPIDAAAVDPTSFVPFLPASDQHLLVDLARGEGVLGATSAELRGLGPGGVLRFEGGSEVTIAGVLPDELVGAAELMVSKKTGSKIGVSHDRYVLLQTSRHRLPSSPQLARRLQALLPESIPPTYRKVQVRAPGETPYFREGDAVLPPALIKLIFGEFAALPDRARPGYLKIDPEWIRRHIGTTTVPVLGTVTCNRVLIPQLREAMRAIQQQGLARAIHSYAGCFAPKFINRNPTSLISHHAWGIAFDVNAGTNPYGAPPHEGPRLVRLLEQQGFIWGGSFVVPDGNHFEYRFSPDAAR